MSVLLFVWIVWIEQRDIFDEDARSSFRSADVEDGEPKVSLHLFSDRNLNGEFRAHFGNCHDDESCAYLSTLSVAYFDTEFDRSDHHRQDQAERENNEDAADVGKA